MRAFVKKTYVILLEKYTSEAMVSCTICEEHRVQTPYMHAFKFEHVNTAMDWFHSMVRRKSFKPKYRYHHCIHVKYDYLREIDYPLVRGELIDEEEMWLPEAKVINSL